VFWEKTAQYLATLPPERQEELAPIRKAWEETRAEARTRLMDHLDGGRYAETVEAFTVFFQTPHTAERQPFGESDMARPRRVRHVLPVILYGRLAAVLAFDEWQRGAATPLPRLHRVRIAAKRLRYTLEFFEEVLGPEAHALIDQMKRLQDHLGEIQDDVVAVTVLRDFLTWGTWRHREGVPTPRAPVLAPGVASYLAARQRDLAQRLEEFPSHWAEFSDGSFTRKLAAALAVLEYGDTHGQS